MHTYARQRGMVLHSSKHMKPQVDGRPTLLILMGHTKTIFPCGANGTHDRGGLPTSSYHPPVAATYTLIASAHISKTYPTCTVLTTYAYSPPCGSAVRTANETKRQKRAGICACSTTGWGNYATPMGAMRKDRTDQTAGGKEEREEIDQEGVDPALTARFRGWGRINNESVTYSILCNHCPAQLAVGTDQRYRRTLDPVWRTGEARFFATWEVDSTGMEGSRVTASERVMWGWGMAIRAMGTAQRRRNLERLGGAEFLAGQWVAARRYIPVGSKRDVEKDGFEFSAVARKYCVDENV
ncbi:hypothetical protein BKA82DRAFT_4015532 [Pisolithus tinctorius]|nr:hypothetical protein BKA82DRAFT_4015532 [Pisolithus tinctorius]